MTQGVISVFRNYNKAQLVVGTGSFTSSPPRPFQLEVTSAKWRLWGLETGNLLCSGVREKENESQSSHWERSKHLLNAYPVSLCAGTFHFIHCILFFWTLGTKWWLMFIGHLFVVHPFFKKKKKDNPYYPHFADKKTDVPNIPQPIVGKLGPEPRLDSALYPHKTSTQEASTLFTALPPS